MVHGPFAATHKQRVKAPAGKPSEIKERKHMFFGGVHMQTVKIFKIASIHSEKYVLICKDDKSIFEQYFMKFMHQL